MMYSSLQVRRALTIIYIVLMLNPIRKFPFFKQLDQMDCGPTCLRMIASFHGKQIALDHLRMQSAIGRDGVSLGGIASAAEDLGFHSLPIKVSFQLLKEDVPLPCIAHWRQRHFVVVYKITRSKVYVADPAHGLVVYSIKEFLEGWLGPDDKDDESYLLMIEPTPLFYENEDSHDARKFGFRFLSRYFKPYHGYIIQLFISLLVGSLLQLIFPFLTQAVVDYGINYQNIGFIYLMLIAQLTLFISQTTIGILRGWLLLHMTSRININLISDFLIKLMRLPISFFDSKNTGDIVQRINDHNRIQTFLSSTTLNTLFSAFNLVIFGAVLFYYNLSIFLIFMLGSLIYVGWTVLFLKRRKELDYKRFDQSADNQSSIYQLITGMQEIKLNGSERRRRWEWEAIQVKLFKVSIKSLALSQTQNNGGGFINEIKNILITFVAASAVISGELTLGMMLSVQYIIGQLNVPVQNFVSFIQAAQDAKISIERLGEIHMKANEEDPSEKNNKIIPDRASIQLNRLSFAYGGKTSNLALNQVSCQIPEGKVTAIVGSSGSGKTTLLKLILRFYEPTEGSILVGASKLENLSIHAWRNACGTVMQDGFLFGDTIARNITESDSDSHTDYERLNEAIRIANLETFIEQLPAGLDTKIGASGMNISGGQAQRIFIARAVYKNPQYLFFDEATSSLDANNERIIMENLNSFYSGRTVVVVAHRLSTVKNADQILVLDMGRIIETGNHNQLVNKKGAYYRLVKNQLELGT